MFPVTPQFDSQPCCVSFNNNTAAHTSNQSLSAAIREAAAHKGYWFLTISFLVCGFQTIFIMIHLPAYLVDQGMSPTAGMTALALIGFFNIVGSYACGLLGGHYSKKKLLIDPGFGFGKNLEHNLRLLRQLSRFVELGVPVLAGLSRKGMIGKLTGRAGDDRVVGSAVAALIAVQNGAQIVRVHDVAATVDALRVWSAVASQPAAVARPAKPAMPKWADDE